MRGLVVERDLFRRRPRRAYIRVEYSEYLDVPLSVRILISEATSDLFEPLGSLPGLWCCCGISVEGAGVEFVLKVHFGE